MLQTICVFCGSSRGKDPVYAREAEKLARTLLQRKINLVYGGANVGLMRIIADTCIEGNGKVIGVMPSSLVEREVAHDNLTEMHIVASMQERKEKMGILSDAFIALPGGYGTFDELFEVLSWCQLGLSSKPVGLLNVGGYFDPLLSMLDHSVAEGFLREEHRNCLISSDDPEELLSQMLVFQPAKVEKWIDRLKQKGY